MSLESRLAAVERRIDELQVLEYGLNAWTTASLLSSWTQFGSIPTAYAKDSFGNIYIRGWVNGGTVGSGNPVFTLPTGYRPTYNHIFPSISSGLTLSRIDVKTTGDVEVIVGNNAWVTLSGIVFSIY